MISNGSLLNSLTPSPAVPSESNPPNVPSDGETPSTFADVLQQQGGTTSTSSDVKGNPTGTATKAPVTTPASPTKIPSATTAGNQPQTGDLSNPNVFSGKDALNPGAAPQSPTETTTPATPPAAKTSTTFSFGSRLSDLMVQASAQPQSSKQTALSSKLPASSATTPPADSGKAANPTNEINVPTLIAQATNLISSAQQASVPTTPSVSTSPNKSQNTFGASDSTKNSAQVTPGLMDLSTLIAQMSAQASTQSPASVNTAAVNVTATSVATGNNFPLSALSTNLSPNATKEKKSTSAGAEGSFLQAGAGSSASSSSASGLLSSLLAGAGESSPQQLLTPSNGTKNASGSSSSENTLSLAGTANVEKGKAMSTDLNFPEVDLLSGSGANTPSMQSGADLNIKLSSNNDFSDALKQVMHVAQLTQTSESRTPMRVAMEIQTPPGAIVNVYVSKTGDQWRAQLSTNDPQALSWVQDQMSSLRQSSNLGVEVRWLPPQMEGTATSASGQDANLGWDRGGQGQSGYQQSDDQQQSTRQKKTASYDDLETVPANSFMNAFTSLGRAA